MAGLVLASHASPPTAPRKTAVPQTRIWCIRVLTEKSRIENLRVEIRKIRELPGFLFIVKTDVPQNPLYIFMRRATMCHMMDLKRDPKIRTDLKRDIASALAIYASRASGVMNYEAFAEFILSDLEKRGWHGVKESARIEAIEAPEENKRKPGIMG